MGQAKLPKAPIDLALGLEPKNVLTYINIDIYIYIEREMGLSYTWCNNVLTYTNIDIYIYIERERERWV